MNKSKSSLIFHINQTETNDSNKSKINSLHGSTLPNIRKNLLNGFFYEGYVEKYNEKINLWQNTYLCVKKNYLYLYDKKPKLMDKPKEFLFLNNKMTITFHKKLFKMKAIKCFVANFKINNEALSKSVMEDNNHNLYISFKSQKNYDNFEKVIENVLKSKQFTNSVSPNQLGFAKKEKKDKIARNNVSTDRKNNKNMSTIHLKTKSMNDISIKKSLIFSGRCHKNEENNMDKKKIEKVKENALKDNSPCSKNNISMNSANKTNNSIHNVFTFSKVDNLNNNANEQKLNNSNNTYKSNKSKSQNQSNSNSQRITNNNTISNINLNENNLFLDTNNLNKSKKNINYFTINFSQNHSMNKNNIFDINDSNLTLSLPPIPKLIYSIRRKKEKEKEDIINFKRHRTKSCFGFSFNNIFLNNEEKKEEKEDKIKKIKIKLKDFNNFCHPKYNKKLYMNLSNYSKEEKEKNTLIDNQENQDNSDTTNLSLIPHDQNTLNDIQEEEKNITESKSKKDNSNNYISFGSLKSFKSESKEEEKEVKEVKEGKEEKEKKEEKEEKEENNTNNINDYFEGLNIYSYVDASETIKNKSNIEDSNPLSSLNVNNIRNQITSVIKQNEEIISEQDKDNDNSDIIFTPRLMEEIQQHKIITAPNSDNKNKEENENQNKNESQKKSGNENNANINSISKNGKIEISSNQTCSNTINTSIVRRKKNLRLSNDLNELIQSLETKNENQSLDKSQFSHILSENNDNNINELDLNNSNINNYSNDKGKMPISNIIDKSLENSLKFSNKFEESNEKEEEKSVLRNKFKSIIPFNTFFDVNLSFNFMNFNLFLWNDKSSLKELLYKIDNNLLFIYDSNILNLLLKKIKNTIQYETSTIVNEIEGKFTKNKILGKIYESLKNKYAKYFILCEMIAIISKIELSKLIVTSMEIYNKKKEINLNEPMIDFDEYIFDIFNKYLSRNEKNKEYADLYENILPKEIKKTFDINDSEGSLINIIKQNINPYTLFNSMQYHNKIYININLENKDYFNYNSSKPFDKKTNHYISPYILEKWKFKASLGNHEKNKEINDIDINTNNNINSTNPINDSFDSTGNYSRDMSNTSLSCIVFDKKNKFRLSLISKSNESSLSNNLFCGLIKKEKRIYEEYKLYERTEEIQKINLFQNIIINMNQNEINSAMKNCEYFLQKYQNSTLFLHPLIYLCLAFIYNKIEGFDSAQKYIEKSLKYLTWLFPLQNCFLFYEIEFKYLLIILNNEENIILNNIENIVNIFEQCNNLWKKYYEDKKNPELKMLEIIFKIYFKMSDKERNDGNFLNDLFYNNIKPLMNDLEHKSEFWKERKEKGPDIFWKLFIEFFKNCPGCDIMVFNDLIRSVSILDN